MGVPEGRIGLFMLTGDGIPPSSAFDLHGFEDSVRVNVKAGNIARRYGGAVLGGVGAVGLLLGGVSLGLHLTPPSTHPAARPSSMRTPLHTPAFLISSLAAGALLSGAGLWLWLTSGTTYTLEQGPLLPGMQAPRGPEAEGSVP